VIEIAWKCMIAIPLRDVRSDLALGYLGCELRDLPLFLGQIELRARPGIDQTFTSKASP